ncbi:MAG: PAS domain S-box protein, partial [Magnetococcales bacterium]|nr:PAS domain S-box protein [Magnetococcales bacterium]
SDRFITENYRHITLEESVKLPDGSILFYDTIKTPFNSPDGKSLGIIGIARDITDRKEKEQLILQASESKFRQLFESNMLAIAFWHLDGGIKDANKAFLDIVGYTKGDLESGLLNWEKMTPPEYLEHDQEAIRNLLYSGLFEPYEKEYFRKDGARISILIGGSLLENSQDAGFMFALDITEQKRNAKALEYQRIFMEAVLDNVTDGIAACNSKGNLSLFNRAARNFHGIDQEDLPSSVWSKTYDLFLPDGQTPIPTNEIPLFRAFNGENVQNEEMIIVPMDREKRLILASGQALYDPEGHKLGAVVSMHDITERRINEQRIIESQIRLEQAQAIAHLGHWTWDKMTQKITCSKECFNILGCDQETWVPTGENFRENMPIEDLKSLDEACQKGFETGESFEIDCRYYRGGNRSDVRWLHVICEIVLGKSGSV